MSESWRVVEFALLSGVIVALALAACSAAVYPLLADRLAEQPAQRRARIAWWWLLGPALAGGLYACATLLSGAAVRTLPAMQASCASHHAYWWHACLWHPMERAEEPWLWIALVVLLLALGSLSLRAAIGLWRGQRQLRTLIALSRGAEDRGDVIIVDSQSPLAIAVGLLGGRFMLSRGLVDALTPPQLEAVIAHERTHLHHRDVLRHLFARACSLLHLPGTRRQLLDQLSLAVEQRCDDAAAQHIGSPLLVAETLLVVERLHPRGGDRVQPLLAMAFAQRFLAERIRALLHPRRTRERALGRWLAAGPVGRLGASPDRVPGLADHGAGMRLSGLALVALSVLLALASGRAGGADQHPANFGDAPSLTLEQAVSLASRQEHIALFEEARLGEARADLEEARQLSNPVLRWEQERGRGSLLGSRETSWSLNQTLDLGGSRGLQRRAAEQGISSAEADLALARWLREQTVRDRFYAAVAAQSRWEATAQRAAALDQLAQQAKARQKAGDLAGFQARRLAMSAAEARQWAAQRHAEVKASRLTLAAAVGEIALDATLIAEPPDAARLNALLAAARPDAHPRLIALERQLEAADAASRAAQRWRLPVEFGFGQKRIDEAGASDDALLLEIGVPLPLFDRNQADAARRRSAADALQGERMRIVRELSAELAAITTQARQQVEGAASYRDTWVPEARALSEIAARSFGAGELDVVGLLETLSAEENVLEQAAELELRAQRSLLDLMAYTPTGENR